VIAIYVGMTVPWSVGSAAWRVEFDGGACRLMRRERERLILRICDSIAGYCAAQRAMVFRRMKFRHQKTSIPVLREILEQDVANAFWFMRKGTQQ